MGGQWGPWEVAQPQHPQYGLVEPCPCPAPSVPGRHPGLVAGQGAPCPWAEDGNATHCIYGKTQITPHADVQGQGSSLVVTQVSVAELGLPDTEIHCPTRRVTDDLCRVQGEAEGAWLEEPRVPRPALKTCWGWQQPWGQALLPMPHRANIWLWGAGAGCSMPSPAPISDRGYQRLTGPTGNRGRVPGMSCQETWHPVPVCAGGRCGHWLAPGGPGAAPFPGIPTAL